MPPKKDIEPSKLQNSSILESESKFKSNDV
jgi:hypothetical protein